MTSLYIQEGSEFRKATTAEVIAHARILISRRFRTGCEVLKNPQLVAEYLRVHLGGLDYEVFGMLHLDNHSRLIRKEDMFRGTLNTSQVSVREVLQSVLANRTSKVILYHNHPSGISEPSTADDFIAKRIRETLTLIAVDVLDHLIVGETLFSFAKAGML